MTQLQSIQGGRPTVLPRREPQTTGEMFQAIIDALHAQDQTMARFLDGQRIHDLQISDLEHVIDKNFPSLPLMVADHDARIKILERMYWRVTGVLLTVTAIIGFVEWWLGRAHP